MAGPLGVFECSEIACLAAFGIEIPALQLAESLRTLPQPGALPPHHRVLRLPESNRKRRGRGIMLYHGIQILVQRGLQTGPVAGGAIRASQRDNAKENET